jgi:hypothetical protein
MPFNIPDQVAGRLHSTVSFFILKFVVGFIKYVKIITALEEFIYVCSKNSHYCKLCLCGELIPTYLDMLQHVYIPIIFSSGVDYIDAPTPYMMGLHSGVDTSGVTMDGVSFNIKMKFPLAIFFCLCLPLFSCTTTFVGGNSLFLRFYLTDFC